MKPWFKSEDVSNSHRDILEDQKSNEPNRMKHFTFSRKNLQMENKIMVPFFSILKLSNLEGLL